MEEQVEEDGLTQLYSRFLIYSMYYTLQCSYAIIHSFLFLWVLYWQEVVDSVSLTTGSCKMMFPIVYKQQ